jgi:hypothetical protein
MYRVQEKIDKISLTAEATDRRLPCERIRKSAEIYCNILFLIPNKINQNLRSFYFRFSSSQATGYHPHTHKCLKLCQFEQRYAVMMAESESSIPG